MKIITIHGNDIHFYELPNFCSFGVVLLQTDKDDSSGFSSVFKNPWADQPALPAAEAPDFGSVLTRQQSVTDGLKKSFPCGRHGTRLIGRNYKNQSRSGCDHE